VAVSHDIVAVCGDCGVAATVERTYTLLVVLPDEGEHVSTDPG
jgi:hypothetical protein